MVQYALKTSRKEAKLQFNVPESTIRMWVKRAEGLYYRPADKVPEQLMAQDTLQDFLLNEEFRFQPENIEQFFKEETSSRPLNKSNF